MNACENQDLPFQELIAECNRILERVGTIKLNTLIEHFSREIDSGQILNYLVDDGRAILTYLLSCHIVRPDDLSALIAMAEVAERTDLKQIIGRYCYPSSETSDSESTRVIDDAFAYVSESIQNDWRNLARQLSIEEFDIARIQASTSNDSQLAASEMLNLFRRKQSKRDLVGELVIALRAIKRFSLATRINELVKTLPSKQES